MLQETASLFTNLCRSLPEARTRELALFRTWPRAAASGATLPVFASSTEDDAEPVDADAGLEDAARTEHDYLRQRLREELQREPTEQELDEWLRRHTEGY
jgi:hypothetical protein